MPPLIAAIMCAIGVVGLFWFERDRTEKTSKALWIPVAWLSLSGSRAVSQWLAAFGWGDALQPFNSPEQVLAGSPIDRAAVMLLLIIGVLVLLKRRRRVGHLLSANLPLVLFFAYCAVSIAWSEYPEVAFKRWIRASGDIVMILIVLSELQPRTAIKRLLAWTSFLLIPLSVLLIKYYPDLGLVYNRWTWTQLYGGVTMNKNTLGMICMLFGLTAESRFISSFRNRELSDRPQKLAAHGSILAMVLWLLWKSNSMTALSCFLVGSSLIFMTTFFRVGRRPAVVFVMVAGMVFLSAYSILLAPDADVLEEVGRNTTLTGRTEIWKLVLTMDSNPVVGTGFDSFWLGKRLERMWAYDHDIHQAHNGYLEVYLNLGWVGLGLLAGILVAGYRRVVAAIRRHEELSGLCLAILAVALIYNFTEAAFGAMCPVWLLLLLATMALPKALAVPSELEREPALTMFPVSVGQKP